MDVKINPNRSADVGTSQSVARRKPVSPAQQTMSFHQTEALERTLKSTPQVRPEKIAQAAALVAGGNYPSDAQLSRLAGFLAPQIASQDS